METIDVNEMNIIAENGDKEMANEKQQAQGEVLTPVEEKTVSNDFEVLEPIYEDADGNKLDKQQVENIATSMTDKADEVIDDTKADVKQLAEDIKNIVYEGKAADIIGYSKDCIPKMIRRFTSEELTKCLNIYDEIFNKDVEDITTYVDANLMKSFIKEAKREHISKKNKDMLKFFIESNIRSFGMDVVFEKSQQMLKERINKEANKLNSPKLMEEYAKESIQNTIIKLTNVVTNLKIENETDDDKVKKQKASEAKRFQEAIDSIKDVGTYNIIRDYVNNHTGILNRNKLFKKFEKNVKDIDQGLKEFGMSKLTFGYIVKTANILMIDPVATMCIAAVLSKLNLHELSNRSFVFYMILTLSAVGYCESENSYTLKETENQRDAFKQLCKDLISKIDEHDKEVIASKAKIKGNIMLKKK